MLTSSPSEQQDSLSLHDRVQIALAIADENILKSLLVDCTPSIAQPHRIGSITTQIGVPVESRKAIDGIIQFEEIHCVLSESQTELEQSVSDYTHRKGNHRGYLDLTRCETDTRTLGQMVSLSQAIALLAQSGFSPPQVNEILQLPYDAWYKSWWYALDAEGSFTIPFLRLFRTRHYTDGSYTLQYKDFFAQEKPACFKSQEQQVLVEIDSESRGFRKTLEKINYSRQQFKISRALLICEHISDLEAKGYISQGISIYAANAIVLPVPANCTTCATLNCPMNGNKNSPVLLCQGFCVDGHVE